jgi:hypothetical protein
MGRTPSGSQREQIEGEIRDVAGFRLCPSLTPTGRALVELLLEEP